MRLEQYDNLLKDIHRMPNELMELNSNSYFSCVRSLISNQNHNSSIYSDVQYRYFSFPNTKEFVLKLYETTCMMFEYNVYGVEAYSKELFVRILDGYFSHLTNYHIFNISISINDDDYSQKIMKRCGNSESKVYQYACDRYVEELQKHENIIESLRSKLMSYELD